MTAPEIDPSTKAHELRKSFDRSFAVPRLSHSSPADDLLLIRSNNRRYALRIAELHGLYADRRITPLPSTDPALLGIAGIRGQVVPVYSLAVLLGGSAGQNGHRWLAVCGRDGVAVALAFDESVGSIRVSEVNIHAPPAPQQLPTHIAQVARIPPENCYVVSTRSILNTLVGRAEENGPADDRDSTDANAPRE